MRFIDKRIGLLLIAVLAVSACMAPPRRPTTRLIQSALAKSRNTVTLVFPDLSNSSVVGSGVFISPDGLMLTNDHVATLAKNGPMIIVAGNGQQYRGTTVGADSFQDIALVKVEPNDAGETFPYIELGDSDAIRVGDWVMAIGNPIGIGNGDGQVTVTLGTVAAKHRSLSPLGADHYARYTNGIQSDLPTHPGNSGGALVDMNGRLIGINGAGGTGGYTGFAIPVNQIVRYMPRLKTGESIVHADLQVEGRGLNVAESRRIGRGGFRVTQWTGSDDKQYALKPKDIILAIDGEPIDSTVTLLRTIDFHEVGDIITLEIDRGGRRLIQKSRLVETKIDMDEINRGRAFGKLQGEAIELLKRRMLEQAMAKFNESLTILPDNPTAHYNVACTFSLMKKADEAFEAMRKSFDFGMEGAGQLRTDPDLAFIRTDPRFEAFYQEMKRKEE